MNEENKIEIEGVMDEGYGIIPKKIMKIKLNDFLNTVYEKQKNNNEKSEKNNIKGQGKNIKLVMCYLLTYGKDECFPSINTISEDLEISIPVIIESLKLLEILGWIEKKRLYSDPMKRQAKYIIKIFKLATLKNLNFDIKKFNDNIILQDINNTNKLSKDNKEDESSLIDFDSNFSPIKKEIIKYFDLYKKLHPMAKKNKFFTKKKINKINRLCKFILNGFPKDKYNLVRTFIKDKNIPYNPDIGLNGDIHKLKELLNIALLSLDVNYEPSNKANITNDFTEFLINDFTEFSYFFTYAFNLPVLLQNKTKENNIPIKKIKNEKALYIKEKLDDCFQFYSINSSIINNFSFDVYNEWNSIVNKEFIYKDKTYIRADIEDKDQFISGVCCLENFIESLDNFITELGESNSNYDFKFIGVRKKDGSKTKFWESFEMYLDKQEIYLYLDEIEDASNIARKVNKYLERKNNNI